MSVFRDSTNLSIIVHHTVTQNIQAQKPNAFKPNKHLFLLVCLNQKKKKSLIGLNVGFCFFVFVALMFWACHHVMDNKAAWILNLESATWPQANKHVDAEELLQSKWDW